METARKYLLPHALFVLYTHLDDRARDRRISISAAEERLRDTLLAEAHADLERVTGDSYVLDLADGLLAEYEEAQARLASEPNELPRLVIGRHLPGIIGSVCALQANGVDSAQINEVLAGFRHLALSLQWMDDLRDVEEDLATGADNLLVAGLPRNVLGGVSPQQVIYLLHTEGLLTFAVEESLRHLSVSHEIALVNDCCSLTEILTARRRWLLQLIQEAQGLGRIIPG